MNHLYIPNTKTTPLIKFDLESDSFIIKGRSLASNTANFYEPVINWLDENLKGKQIKLRIELEYFNTTSQKYLLIVMDKVHQLSNSNIIVWAYDEDDDEMQEIGKKMETMSGCSFEYLELEED